MAAVSYDDFECVSFTATEYMHPAPLRSVSMLSRVRNGLSNRYHHVVTESPSDLQV